jgi:hypothetical protein
MSLATTNLNAILSFPLDFPVIANAVMEPASIWTVLYSVVGGLVAGAGGLWGIVKWWAKRSAKRVDGQEKHYKQIVDDVLKEAREERHYYRDKLEKVIEHNTAAFNASTDSSIELTKATKEQSTILCKLTDQTDALATNQQKVSDNLGNLTDVTRDLATTTRQMQCVVQKNTDQGDKDTRQ